MKHNRVLSPGSRAPLYPNAADASYFTDKALELLAALCSSALGVTAMLILLIMA